MRRATAGALKEGDILSRDIITPEGRLLLKKGLSLSQLHIERIKKLAISYVYLRNLDLDININIEENELIPPNIRWEINELVRSIFTYYSTYRVIELVQVKKAINSIIEEVGHGENILIQLSSFLHTYGDYRALHAVNNCILVVALGRLMHYNQLQLEELATGVLLQDIGMLELPEEIINQPKACSQEELTRIKRHPQFSYDILNKYKEIGMLSCLVALQHHERFDGTGYPGGLKGEEISPYAIIAALVDVYNALTADRPHRKRMLPHEAYEYFTAYGGSNFDLQITKIFLSKLVLYPNGTLVKLSNGEKGIVLRQNLHFPSRPTVWPLEGKQKELDLMENVNIMIIGVGED